MKTEKGIKCGRHHDGPFTPDYSKPQTEGCLWCIAEATPPEPVAEIRDERKYIRCAWCSKMFYGWVPHDDLCEECRLLPAPPKIHLE
jgi:hypothetical protein